VGKAENVSRYFYVDIDHTNFTMAAKQRMRIASEKHSKNITTRGNVPKSLVRIIILTENICDSVNTSWKWNVPT